mmetsp:Transcript_20987/g.83681  ORF Transcript_20987/g.83681 Transcript_20987/m.83681 type:complete len:224 (+) Transcript_20987:557-1228(+)
MCDDDDGLAARSAGREDAVEDALFRREVDGRGRLVEQHKFRIRAAQRARQREPRALPARDIGPARGDAARIVPARPLDPVVNVREFRRGRDALESSVVVVFFPTRRRSGSQRRIRDGVLRGAAKGDRGGLVGHAGLMLAQVGKFVGGQRPHVATVDAHFARVRSVEAEDEPEHRRLARPSRAREAVDRAARDAQRRVLQRDAPVSIRQRHVAQLDVRRRRGLL